MYYREPGGVLFEIATNTPGFAVDEPVESLGEGTDRVFPRLVQNAIYAFFQSYSRKPLPADSPERVGDGTPHIFSLFPGIVSDNRHILSGVNLAVRQDGIPPAEVSANFPALFVIAQR